MSVQYIIILLVNFGFTFFFTHATYLLVGIIYTAMTILITFFFYNTQFAHMIVKHSLVSCGNELVEQGKIGKQVIISAACLTLGMEIEAILALITVFIGIGILALAIFIACNTVFSNEGPSKIGKSLLIARLVTKIYLFFTSILDKIIEKLVEIEFRFLKIKRKK